MAYDERLAEQIRGVTSSAVKGLMENSFSEGSFSCSIATSAVEWKKARLMVCVTLDLYEALLKKLHAREMDFTRKPLKGFPLLSEAEACLPAYRVRRS